MQRVRIVVELRHLFAVVMGVVRVGVVRRPVLMHVHHVLLSPLQLLVALIVRVELDGDVGFTHHVVVVHDNHALVRVTVTWLTFPDLQVPLFRNFYSPLFGDLVFFSLPVDVFLVVFLHGALDDNVRAGDHGGGASNGHGDFALLLQLHEVGLVHLDLRVWVVMGGWVWGGCHSHVHGFGGAGDVDVARPGVLRPCRRATLLLGDVDDLARRHDLLAEDEARLDARATRHGALQ